MLAALSPATLLLIPLAVSGGALLWVVWAPASLRRKGEPKSNKGVPVLDTNAAESGGAVDAPTLLRSAGLGVRSRDDEQLLLDEVVGEVVAEVVAESVVEGVVVEEPRFDDAAAEDAELSEADTSEDETQDSPATEDVSDSDAHVADGELAGITPQDEDVATEQVLHDDTPEADDLDAAPSLLGLFAEDSVPDPSDTSWLGAVQRAVVEDGLAGLFDDAPPVVARPSEEPQVAQVMEREKPKLRRRRSDARVSLAKFPFDPEVWDDPLSPRAMRRAQRKSEIQEKRAQQENTRARKALDKTRARLGELEKLSVVEAEAPQAAPEGAPFGDVWSRAANADAPEQSGIEQPRERTKARDEKKALKKAERAKAKAAREGAKLAKLISEHALEEERRTAEEAEKAALVVPEELVSIIGVGDAATTEVEVSDSDEVVSYGEDEEETGLLVEVIEGDLGDEPATSVELSDREVKRSEKKAEKESRRLEKLSLKDAAGKKARGSRKGGADSADHAQIFEGGLGSESVVADSGAADIAGDAARGWEQAAAVVEQPALSASTWEVAADAVDGLQEAAVSSWEAAAAGVSTFIDPTGGARATNVGELVELGETIEDTASRGPGRGREAIHGTDDPEIEASDIGMIVEISNVPTRKKRRFVRQSNEVELEEDTTPISEWVSEGTTLVTVTSDAVDHRQFDLPEPIPDRVIVTFGGEE